MAKVSKDAQRGYFYEGAYPTDVQMDNVVDSQLGLLDDAGSLPVASAANLGDEYKIGNTFYKCVLNSGTYEWQSSGTVTPVDSYNDLDDKPKIGGVTLAGAKTVDQLGGMASDESVYNAADSVNASDTVYVCQAGTWKRTTVGELRKPSTAQVSIAAGAWSQVGDFYEAVASVNGITSTSIVMATPAPESIPVYNETPFWVSSLGTSQVTIQSTEQVLENIKINLIFW